MAERQKKNAQLPAGQAVANLDKVAVLKTMDALVESGSARWILSWCGSMQLQLASGEIFQLDAASVRRIR